MNEGCDRSLFEVEVRMPVVMRVLAFDAESALKAACKVKFVALTGLAIEAVAQGFPESISCKEVGVKT
jgi:hypothetical protein